MADQETARQPGGDREALLRVAQALAREHTLDSVAHVVVEEAQRVLGSAQVGLWLADFEQRWLELLTSRGFSAQFVNDQRLMPLDSATATALAARTGEPVEISDPSRVGADLEQMRALAEQEGVRVLLAQPLLLQGRVVGVLTFVPSPNTPREFTPRERELARLFADLAAVAVENARLTEECTHRAEAAEAAREEIAAVLEGMSDGYVALDREWRYTYVNRPAERLLRRTRQDLLGKSIWDLFPPTPESGYHAKFQHAMHAHEGVFFEEYYAPLGTWFAVRAHPTKTGMAVFFQDITARKRASEGPRANEARFRCLFDSNMLGIGIWGTGRGVVEANDALLHILGYTRSEMAVGNVPWDRITPPEYRALDLRADEAARAAGSCTPYEKELLRKDGSRVAVLVGAARMKEDPDTGVAFVLDISERKHAGGALQFLSESTRRLAESLDYETTLVRVARLAIPFLGDYCVIDLVEPDGSLRRVAAAHHEPKKEELARQALFRFPPDPGGPHPLAIVVRTGKPWLVKVVTEEAVRSLARDEEHLGVFRTADLKSTLSVPLIARGRTLGVLSVAISESGRRYQERDVALVEELARRAALAIDNAELYQRAEKLNRELQQRLVDLGEANRELEAFASSLPHDLQEPLAAIDKQCRALREDHALEPAALRLLDQVRSSTRTMGRLIDRLLTFSHLGRQPLAKQAVETHEIVREALDELGDEHRARREAIVIGDLPPCEGDPALLKHVWTNLLTNALKFTRERKEPRIEVGARVQDGECVYYVKDNGVGFNMKHAGKLFGPFQRLHSPEEYEGSGVGLAIVKSIVQRHGGRVWVKSQAGRGATFFFTLSGTSTNG